MKKGRKDGICYSHTSRHLYGNYVLHINVVAQKVPEHFVVLNGEARNQLVKDMGWLGEFMAEDLFPVIQEKAESES